MLEETSKAPRVLIVDDDSASLDVLEAMIEGARVRIVRAHGGKEAQKILHERGLETFSCVFTDFRMPQVDGLDLLTWVYERDPTLATIIITAQGDKDLVTTSLRKGAADFVEKPFRLAEIRSALKKGIEYTDERRKLETAASEVKDITKIHDRLSKSVALHQPDGFATDYAPVVATGFYPIQETGGDFVNCFPISEQHLMVVIGDVSGHDLKAGFISSYFQGIVRGMVRMQAGLEEISNYFNGFLISEWNREGVLTESEVATSLAATFLLFDFENMRLSVLNNGLPQPSLFSPEQPLLQLGLAGPPLGWFEPLESRQIDHPLKDDGICIMWSDGLIDVAHEAEISPYAASYVLVHKKDSRAARELLAARNDDVLAVEVRWGASRCTESGAHTECYFPIFYDSYCGAANEEIDEFQKEWTKALAVCLPDLSRERRGEILLCGREALLNSMVHGSRLEEGKCCSFLMAVNAHQKVLRLRVDDEGEGYDAESPLPSPFNEPDHQSLGIQIMRSYADVFTPARRGASLTLEFSLA